VVEDEGEPELPARKVHVPEVLEGPLPPIEEPPPPARLVLAPELTLPLLLGIALAAAVAVALEPRLEDRNRRS
jgi:hypothetical protein